ncbi:T9SS type A sorting domain-containing protein [Flavobacterium sp. CGRL1]
MIKNYLLLLALCFFTSLKAQIINIPDSNFKTILLEAGISNSLALDKEGNRIVIDINQDKEIQLSEALNVHTLFINKSNISSLVGIKDFTNLTFLYCEENQISSLDVSGLNLLNIISCKKNNLKNLNVQGCVSLDKIDCSENQLTSLDLQGCEKLTNLECQDNPLSSLNASTSLILRRLDFSRTQLSNFEVKNFLNLEVLYCSDSYLSVLDLKGLTKLEILLCAYNNLRNLDVVHLVNLKQLMCRGNLLNSLNVSNLTNLELLDFGNSGFDSIDITGSVNITSINFYYTSLTSIDLNELKVLKGLWVGNNPLLESIFAKNGSVENNVIIFENEKLKYICVDEEQIVQMENFLNESHQLNVNVNSFCSFGPGGDNYLVTGKKRFDLNANGCDLTDIPADVKLNITDGVLNGNVISKTEDYSIIVQAGNYSITPILENPNYFTVSPTFFQVEFPAQTSPFIQNFCVTPLGVHHDLEVVFIPIDAARPGFDANYKLVYKNKGNTTQSGTIYLNFDDSVLDLVSSNFGVSAQTINNLVWSFSNLKPFESREIQLVFNVNSPTEIPSVNINDILKYKATISSQEIDEVPADNIFEFNQTVVGSYDPNDKMCLEGNVIKPELIGEFVHYLIRFENTGSYNAENIVVKDIVDASKFDISTLIPTSASHPYTTKISGNKVEFIFEKINLPFDDANNDGYIAFKIKTLPTLNVGDSFENEANIYFDYNFPILTNKAVSTFKTLGIQDFEFSSYFNIYPNPVKDILNIESKNTIEKVSIEIFDVLGQLIIAVPNADTTIKIDVSRLNSGSYILKTKTNKGSSGVKFIKI